MRVIDHRPSLHIAEVPSPTPKAGEVLIRVAYAGVNRPDILQRRGSYPPPADATPYLGLEVSGSIIRLGEGVNSWEVGQQVCALTPGGGYAEEVVTAAEHCFPIPQGFSMLQAAAVPETYLTVWANLIERGRLCAGETVLIHGGSSGIGITAIHLAKWAGAIVITTVGNEEKMRICTSLGADHVINYKTQDFQEVVKEITHGQGVNMVLDMVAGPYVDKNVRSLALEGRLVQIAFLQGSKVEVDWNTLMMRRLTFTGSTLRARPLEEKSRLVQTLHARIWPELEAGRLLPVIDSEFPFAEVEKAHDLMESSVHIGKIMLKVGQN
jgi:NADPH:quinone reductase